MVATSHSVGLMASTRTTPTLPSQGQIGTAFNPQQQPEFLHLWTGFYYGEMAATELSERLADMAPDRQLQRFSAETHHHDEQWHADVFRMLVNELPDTPDMPAAPDWALDIIERVRTCNSYVELTIGSLVVEASAVFLLELQSEFSGDLGHTFRKMLLQEKGHVAFATRYLRQRFQTGSAEEKRELRKLLLDTFRYMRDRIRPAFVELHLHPVLPLLGISAQDYRDRARLASRSVLRSILR
ncbi:MAG: ferritin-like domain-containing protein [Cyanobacteria bacterium P01_E01_bin.45]